MNIKALRESSHLTQKEVADMIGVDVSTYNRYERGKYKISKAMRLALSTVFGVGADKIVVNQPSGK